MAEDTKVHKKGRANESDSPISVENFPERYKEFFPASFAIEHKTSVVILLMIIGVMGAFSYQANPKESFPQIPISMLAVNTVYGGVSPGDVESQVTRVLEEELSTITELKDIINHL